MNPVKSHSPFTAQLFRFSLTVISHLHTCLIQRPSPEGSVVHASDVALTTALHTLCVHIYILNDGDHLNSTKSCDEMAMYIQISVLMIMQQPNVIFPHVKLLYRRWSIEEAWLFTTIEAIKMLINASDSDPVSSTFVIRCCWHNPPSLRMQ